MNKLVLIGNGFDLAHGLKTSYNDFILWYMKSCFVCASVKDYVDTLIEIRINPPWGVNIDAVESLVDKYYNDSFKQILSAKGSIGWNESDTTEPFVVKIKSKFLEVLLSNCSHTTWVEIETEFYELLKTVLRKDAIYTDKEYDLSVLNNSIRFLTYKLEDYFHQLPTPSYDDRYGEIFSSPLKKFDILLPWSEGPQWRDERRFTINRTCILNFNYTQTPSLYTKNVPTLFTSEFINIHGQLGDNSNPIIFGFGDEFDEDYLKMERERAKGYFEYIKSFWYFRASNYGHLIRFIDSEEYIIYVLGHSCGLSDRTMLHMIFEHVNCKSIKIFYYGDEISNNYTEITYEIARHFNDKELMRRRIIPVDRSIRMPQFNDK